MASCKCGTNIPKKRLDLGYTVCVKCSIEKPKTGYMHYPHKTGGHLIIASPETVRNLKRLDRRDRTSPLDRPEMLRSSTNSKKLTEDALGPTPITGWVIQKQRPFEPIKDEFETVGNEAILAYSSGGYKAAYNIIEKATLENRIPIHQRQRLLGIIAHFATQPDQKHLRRSLKKINGDTTTKNSH